MNKRFPMPKRATHCFVLAAVSAVLLFAAIFVTAMLTGEREIEQFTQRDNIIFCGFIVTELIIFAAYMAFLIGGSRIARMRHKMIAKYQNRFSFVDNSRKLYGDVERDMWQDVKNGRRALSYRDKKLLLLLVEQYDPSQDEWHTLALRVYDSQYDIEKSLREEYGFDILPEAEKRNDGSIRVSIEEFEE